MNIKDLIITEICEKIKGYFPPFINDDFYFQESILEEKIENYLQML